MASKLVEAFTATELPVGHLDAFKEGAAYGYLLAKRQMVEAIDSKVGHLEEHADKEAFFSGMKSGLSSLRDYVRNAMLFKKE